MRQYHVLNQSMGFVATSWSFPAGSSLDPPGLEGLAHLSAELALRGTARKSREELARELEFLGCSPAVEVGVESAHFGFECPTRYLQQLADLLHEVFLEPTYDQEELARLKRQLFGEMAELKDNDSAASNLFFGQALYAGDPYGHPIRGYQKSVERISVDDIRAFRQAHYARHRLLLGVAGTCEQSEFNQRFETVLGHFPQGQAVELPALLPHAVDGLDVLLVTRPGRTQAQVTIGQRAVPGNSPYFTPLRLATVGFGGTFTAPLVREIREKRGWSYGVSASLLAGRRSGSFKMRFAPKNSDVLPAIKLSLKMLNALVQSGPTEKNLQFTKRFLVQQYPFLVETPLARLDQMLHIAATGKPADYLETYCERVQAVTVPSALEAVQTVLSPGRQTIVVLGDPSLERPLAKLAGVGRFRTLSVEWDQDVPR